MRSVRRALLWFAWVLAACPATAQPSAPASASSIAQAPDGSALNDRVNALASQLRCVVCQNESVADSQAPLAADLRDQIRRQLGEGRSDEQIRAYMTERYGDFVLYGPPLKGRTVLLWFGPGLMLALGGAVLALTLRQRRRHPAADFEPSGPDDEDQSAAKQ